MCKRGFTMLLSNGYEFDIFTVKFSFFMFMLYHSANRFAISFATKQFML